MMCEPVAAFTARELLRLIVDDLFTVRPSADGQLFEFVDNATGRVHDLPADAIESPEQLARLILEAGSR